MQWAVGAFAYIQMHTQAQGDAYHTWHEQTGKRLTLNFQATTSIRGSVTSS